MSRRAQFHQLVLPHCLLMAYLMELHVLRGFLPGPVHAPIVQARVCTPVYGVKHQRACVCVKRSLGLCKCGNEGGPERQLHDSFPFQADLSFLALGLVCLFCLMMLTFVLDKLACCKARICGLLGLQLFGRLRIFFITSGPKRMSSDDRAALITHLPFTF